MTCNTVTALPSITRCPIRRCQTFSRKNYSLYQRNLYIYLRLFKLAINLSVFLSLLSSFKCCLLKWLAFTCISQISDVFRGSSPKVCQLLRNIFKYLKCCVFTLDITIPCPWDKSTMIRMPGALCHHCRHACLYPRIPLILICDKTSRALSTLRPEYNGRRLADDIFKSIFFKECFSVLIQNSLKFVPEDPVCNTPSFVHVMYWRREGDKPLPEPLMTQSTDADTRHQDSTCRQHSNIDSSLWMNALIGINITGLPGHTTGRCPLQIISHKKNMLSLYIQHKCVSKT